MTINSKIVFSLFLAVVFAPTMVFCSEGELPVKYMNLGEVLPLWSCFPFGFMLLSIALFPLFAPNFWHHHFIKISIFWAASLAIPCLIVYRGLALYEILYIIIKDYIPFMILLWSLYAVSGGILLRGTLIGTPFANTCMLAVGTLLASFMGTTGAAMLMIRPFLRANNHRKQRTFMVVFFIFLIGNVGGSLTPLGDPPLFLGFLHGVPFFWTLNIAPHCLMVAGLLLVCYFFMDVYYYRHEKPKQIASKDKVPLGLEGKHNFLFLAAIVVSILISGIVDWGEVSIFGVHVSVHTLVRNVFMLVIGILSIVTTPITLYEENNFTWAPIIEVAYLFIGIFITMIPCLLILKAGSRGALAFFINSVQQPAHYFWTTGIFSAFLDNAPTYLTFFNTALGKFYSSCPEAEAVTRLIAENPIYLKAISTGAVFFGACSYIGNAPNFMVRSIAEETGTPMPSFFGYIFKYSFVFLIPIFAIATFIFF